VCVRTNHVPTAFLKQAAVLVMIMLVMVLSACQTPPKKNSKAISTNRTNASTSRQSALYDGIDLFSASAERFGTDPRAARPVLVADTVWIVVVGAAGVISLAALVSGIRSARAGRSSPRRRT
jgi:hypothetical protein